MNERTRLSPRVAEQFRRLSALPEAARAEALAQLRARDAGLGIYLAELLQCGMLGATQLSGAHEGELLQLADGSAEPIDRQVGAWQLEALIGRGGMGEVWRAQRNSEGLEQVAALKLLKRGMDSDAVLARFLQERRILAQLQHPNIARLLDGGVTRAGRPYCVMELVDGQPLVEHVESRRLNLRDTLGLFTRICAAVDFAHRNLIVHRDLKPSNILVEDSGEPKLLDFGIAKFLHADEAQPTLTATGINALTPAYAAPEQLYGQPITTATDVFALGLILYQLITGDLPEQRRRSSIEALQVDLDEDIALRPSQVLRRFEERAVPAEPPRILSREVRGDLDAIVLTALRRDPERRYASVAAMSDDIQRLLDGHPVSARPDSLGYRMGRFARRHRAAVAAGTLALAALCVGLVLALWQARVAQEALAQLESEMRRAEQEAERAESAKNFLVQMFQIANPNRVEGDTTLTVRELLLSADTRLDIGLVDQPLAQAELRTAIATALRGYGEQQVGRELIDKTLRQLQHLPQDQDATLRVLASTLQIHASLLIDEGALTQAEAAALQSQTVFERLPESPSLRQGRRALNTSLSLIYNLTGRNNAALDLRRADLEARAAELSPDHPELATSWYNLGISYLQAERHQEALHALHRTEQIMAPLGELASPRRVFLWASLSLVHASVGDDSAARMYLERLRQLLDAHMPERRELYNVMFRTAAAVALLANRLEDALDADSHWTADDLPNQQSDLATQLVPRITLQLLGNHFAEALELSELAEAESNQRRGPDHYLSIHMRAAAAYAAWMLHDDTVQRERLIDAVTQLQQAPTRRHYGQAAAWLARGLRPADSVLAAHWAEQAELALSQAYGADHPWRQSLAGTRIP